MSTELRKLAEEYPDVDDEGREYLADFGAYAIQLFARVRNNLRDVEHYKELMRVMDTFADRT